MRRKKYVDIRKRRKPCRSIHTSNVIRNLINYIFLNPEKRRPNIIDVGVVNHSNLIPNQA